MCEDGIMVMNKGRLGSGRDKGQLGLGEGQEGCLDRLFSGICYLYTL